MLGVNCIRKDVLQGIKIGEFHPVCSSDSKQKKSVKSNAVTQRLLAYARAVSVTQRLLEYARAVSVTQRLLEKSGKKLKIKRYVVAQRVLGSNK